MKIIGVDIGTTTLSFVVLDTESGKLLECVNLPNPAVIADGEARMQDPEVIVSLIRDRIAQLKERHAPIDAVGLDGQMHGMLYVDRLGRAVSPLYTWQDGHGQLDAGGETYAQRLTRLTGYPMATGFGLTTHFVLLQKGKVPDEAAKLCTIADYAAMALAGLTEPVCHASNAASMGLFDTARGAWDLAAVTRAGIAPDILPEVARTSRIIGHDADGVPVACAIGDNQASFIGSVSVPESSVLVNVGTGGQVSMMGCAGAALRECETRPLEGERMLLVGSSLCGGRAYAMLHRFFLSCARLAGSDADSLYEQMNREAMAALERTSLKVGTRLCGSRVNPQERGSITGIDDQNLTPGALCAGVLHGMADELFAFYGEMLRAGARPAQVMIVSGNGVRRNPALRKALHMRFNLEMKAPAHLEEAAYGAALSAVLALGGDEAYARARGMMGYLDADCGRD